MCVGLRFLGVILRAQHNAVFIVSVDVHVARSAGWRKKFTNSLCKLRTPGIFSQGAIASDRDKMPGVPIKTYRGKFLSHPKQEFNFRQHKPMPPVPENSAHSS